MKAVIYARFSSDRQTEDSIAAQVRACREYAAAHGLEVVSVYADEAISGKGEKTARRVQYQKMIRDAAGGGFGVILIHKYDRIARSLSEHVTLEKRLNGFGVELIATAQNFGQTKEAKIMRTLMWSLSEYYIDNLASEVKKGHRETALKALHNGGVPPFGYDVVNQRYVVNEIEAGFVRRIFDAAADRQGFTAIIAEMKKAGITGKRGKPIQYTQIYEMLRNEKYTGVYLYSPQESESRDERRSKESAIRIENALPAIITKEQFQEVQSIMKNRKQTGRKAGYLCSGLVYCECGAKMHARTSTGKGHTYVYFSCSGKCGAPSVRMDTVDDAARKYLETLLSESNQQKIADALREYKGSAKDRLTGFKRAQKNRIAEKQREYDALLKNLSTGLLPPEILQDVGNRAQAIKSEIAALETMEPPKDYTVDQVRAWLEAIKAAPTDKAVRLLIDRIDVKREKEKTEFSIESTLNSVLGKNGCGGTIPILPAILFSFRVK